VNQTAAGTHTSEAHGEAPPASPVDAGPEDAWEHGAARRHSAARAISSLPDDLHDGAPAAKRTPRGE